ncbi:alpha/beta hydrolase [Streptomyces sp. NPDC052107]|uniref:alpha/beta fold hydrolase n=1 Tax=Streptomyces sp. NPDC052107 TaxID=3155632 RepID=UPI0034251263
MPTPAEDFTVIAVDQRGRGLTDKPRDGYDSGTLAGDLVALTDALGHQRFAVVGHDTGMPIAYALAADHPERVDRLVVAEAPSPASARHRRCSATPGSTNCAAASQYVTSVGPPRPGRPGRPRRTCPRRSPATRPISTTAGCTPDSAGTATTTSAPCTPTTLQPPTGSGWPPPPIPGKRPPTDSSAASSTWPAAWAA